MTNECIYGDDVVLEYCNVAQRWIDCKFKGKTTCPFTDESGMQQWMCAKFEEVKND